MKKILEHRIISISLIFGIIIFIFCNLFYSLEPIDLDNIIYNDVKLQHDIYPATMSEQKVVNNCKSSCFNVDGGINLFAMPDKKMIEYISIIKPSIFGSVLDTKQALEWIENIDEDLFKYNFKKFYGSRDFSYLMQIESAKVDIIGYCPINENISSIEFSDRIDKLKKRFPNKKILIGPCVDLFDKVIKSAKKPDILGFEIFKENFDNYINGIYDGLILETKNLNVNPVLFLTITNSKDVDLNKLRYVLEKATSQKLRIGYTFDGSDRIFDFIISHKCSFN